jgi:hypothetical protein
VTSVWVASRASAVAQPVIAGYARGDAVLFESGGVMLLEALRIVEPQLSYLGVTTAVSLVAVAFIELVPTAMVLVALGRRERVSFMELTHHALDSIGTLGLLLGLTFAAQALIVVLFVALASNVVTWFRAAMPFEDLVQLAVLFLGLGVVVALRLVHDLARAAAVDGARGLYDSVCSALAALTPTAAWSYLWRGGLALAALLIAALIASPYRLAMSIVVHALALLVVVVLRVDWLAVALGAVRHGEVRSHD